MGYPRWQSHAFLGYSQPFYVLTIIVFIEILITVTIQLIKYDLYCLYLMYVLKLVIKVFYI